VNGGQGVFEPFQCSINERWMRDDVWLVVGVHVRVLQYLFFILHVTKADAEADVLEMEIVD
jgi:hypothetical protein